MTPDGMEISPGAAVGIARIEATLEGLKRQIDQQDRNSAQLVKLFEERMVGRLDAIERRLDGMEKAREAARSEQIEERKVMEARLKELELKSESQVARLASEAKREADALAQRVGSIEDWKQRIVGVGIGIGIASGSTVAAVLKIFGGV